MICASDSSQGGKNFYCNRTLALFLLDLALDRSRLGRCVFMEMRQTAGEAGVETRGPFAFWRRYLGSGRWFAVAACRQSIAGQSALDAVVFLGSESLIRPEGRDLRAKYCHFQPTTDHFQSTTNHFQSNYRYFQSATGYLQANDRDFQPNVGHF